MRYERPNIAAMRGYSYGEQPSDSAVVKLNTNENPYPPSPKVAQVLRDFDVETLRRYPDATASGVRRTISQQFGLDPSETVITNGGDEGIRLAVNTFVDPGECVAVTSPGYSLYSIVAAVHQCEVYEVALTDEWQLPEKTSNLLNEQGVKLFCIENPHSPTGALFPLHALAEIAESFSGLVLIDEAYVDFVDPALSHDTAKLVAAHDNVLILRTLSKGHSLAGLRLGWLMGHRDLIEPIATKTRDSYNIDTIAQRVAAAAIQDTGHAHETWQRIRAERSKLECSLIGMGFHVANSQTNFLWARCPPQVDADTIYERLRRQNILVRHFSDPPRISQFLRITIGTPKQNELLATALSQMVADP